MNKRKIKDDEGKLSILTTNLSHTPKKTPVVYFKSSSMAIVTIVTQ